MPGTPWVLAEFCHNRIVQSPHDLRIISTYVGNTKKVRSREDDNYSN